MINDRPRTQAYKNAITPALFRDKIVMDVGCGSGILSLFAAQAGARKVYAVEASDMAEAAQAIVWDNAMGHIIQVVKCKLEDIPEYRSARHSSDDSAAQDGIPPNSVDIIMSEWMGFHLVHEYMLASVIVARDRFLKKTTGLMLPNTATIFIAPVNMAQHITERVDAWSDCYGFDFSAMGKIARAAMLEKPEVQVIDPVQVLAQPLPVVRMDCSTITHAELISIMSPFTFNFNTSDTALHGFACWFEVTFPGTSAVLSTSPTAPATHWKQSVFFIPRGIAVGPNALSQLSGHVEFAQDRGNARLCSVSFALDGIQGDVDDNGSDWMDEDESDLNDDDTTAKHLLLQALGLDKHTLE